MIKQKIIVASNINESEKLKSLAILGEKTFNVRYMSTLELAKYLLESSGVTYKEKFLSNDDLSALIYSEVKQIKYFEKLSFNDVLHLVNSINDLRRCIVKDEDKTIHEKLPKDIFVEKNDAIIKVYEIMMRKLVLNRFIDEIGIIRLALNNTKAFPNIDFVVYENSDVLNYGLDMALIDKAHGSVVKSTKVCDSDKPLHIDSYLKSFGQTNEIESVLSYIYQNNIPFDQCVIASAETNDYSNILKNYSDLLQIPLTIGTGTILIETNPGRLFSLINDWMDSHYHREYLKTIINDQSFLIDNLKNAVQFPSPEIVNEFNKNLEYPEQFSFDSLINTAGDLRLSFNKEDNERKLTDYVNLIQQHQDDGKILEVKRRTLEIHYLNRLVGILNKGMVDFIGMFSNITDEAKDINALAKIVKATNYLNYGVPYQDIRKTIFEQKVGRQSSKEGKLYFTSINNALSCLRPYLFIVGLSSNNFPGSSKEDSFFLDRDYEAFGIMNASNRSVESNKNAFFSLLEEAKKHDVHINLSYSYYNSESLKEQNASSVVFETYQLENGKDKTIKDFEEEFDNNPKFKKVEYFDNNLLPITPIGKAVSNNDKISFEKLERDETEQEVRLDFMLKKPKGFSASAVTQYAKCPYLFYLEQVLRIPQPEEVDIYEIIPPNELGTMAHYLLETLDKSIVTSKEAFGVLAGNAFDEYLIMHQTDNMVLANKEKDEFVDMMKIAYEMEGDTKTFLREEDITCLHKSGIRIHGFPDKVIQNKDGSVTVVDYKTGRSISHDASDIPSMIQCSIYSYILKEYKHLDVSGFEYWYLRHGVKIYSGDDNKTMSDHYTNLDNVLNDLFISLSTGTFKPNTKYCDSCYHKDGCPRKK